VNLDTFLGLLNANVFFREFAFSRNQFSPEPKVEHEFADLVVYLDSLLMVYQIKERDASISCTPAEEERWFRRKVLGKATRQIRDTLRYLQMHEEITLRNDRGHILVLRKNAVQILLPLVIYACSSNLPRELVLTKHYHSSTIGFIHILSALDYSVVCSTLVTPSEVAEYLIFRQQLTERWPRETAAVDEASLLGQFISGQQQSRPTRDYARHLLDFKQDIIKFDISLIVRQFLDKIEFVGRPGVGRTEDKLQYYQIVKELAKLDRAEQYEFKRRFDLCIKAIDQDQDRPPMRVGFPRTGCAFVFVPTMGKMFELRHSGLYNFTLAAKYDLRFERCVGVSFVKDGDHYLIDWLYIEGEWEFDRELDLKLRDNNPFPEVNLVPFDRYGV
jgi:hypothetical protein